MKFNIVILIVIVIGTLFLFAGKIGSQPVVENNIKKDFMSTYRDTKNGLLVDVRTKDEYDTGHIAGAINIDFYSSSFIENIKNVSEGKHLFIYCRSGARSGKAVEMLKAEGLTVEDLPGGIIARQDLIGL
ncbi:MAG: rhodanese-like domain-containing protein [Candidatus Pacebacteria bacterium]|nr:rhodanese-like domain-containing protein [Candidatus Paceibacterota bacterium]MCF7857470.1 rhodanese-like domain-containing protein [Candidatus Paceibacterota bacterium]